MTSLPAAHDSDAEDVAWGLQTAEALWKRGERIDAIVWLRRAAQAALEIGHEERALEIGRAAADLSDWLATESAGPSGLPRAHDSEAPTSVTTQTAEPVFAAVPPPSESTLDIPMSVDDVAAAAGDSSRDLHGASAPPASAASPGAQQVPSVPPAAVAHAGMFDPWAAESAAEEARARAPAHTTPDLPEIPEPISLSPEVVAQGASHDADESDVVTSVPGAAVAAATAPSPRVPGRPPPLPPKKPAPKAPRPLSVPPASPSVLELDAKDPEPIPRAAPVPAIAAPVEAPAQTAQAALDLETVDAFSDLPDDAREDFARAAQVHDLAEGEEASNFALAYVVKGAFDVAATMVDAPALRLATGAVLRARGTSSEAVPIRVVAAGGPGVVATWSDAAVVEAFRTCPWVEDDLRAAADKMLTLVGITIGPLGERLDPALREEIVSRLTLRSLLSGEVIAEQGAPVPGLFLVGIGEIELVNGDQVTGVVSSGEFLFPGEVLGAGNSPSTARAGKGGALVMYGGRGVAQELLVTCPPLLEVFAGM